MNTAQIELIKVKLEILKLKADDYSWQCHTPKDVKDQLEAMLIAINTELEELL